MSEQFFEKFEVHVPNEHVDEFVAVLEKLGCSAHSSGPWRIVDHRPEKVLVGYAEPGEERA